MEPDKTTDTTAIKVLPRRVRFYHAKIDGNCLQSGESYTNLKNVSVILITPYNSFGRNHIVYTVRNTYEEDLSLPYDDGAKTIFLYTKGTKGNPPEELHQLLHYMEHTKEENAVNDSLKSLTGCSLSNLYRYIAANTPVIVWNSMYMRTPHAIYSYYYDHKTWYFYSGEHCVVLCGYDKKKNKVLINDPLSGLVWRDADAFERIYNKLGKMAVVLTKE